MKRYSLSVLFMFFVVGCSSSPSCDTSKPTSKWHNCTGVEIVKGEYIDSGEEYIRSTYVGQFKHGKWHGEGELKIPNGSTYVGEFRNQRFHGYGTHSFHDGTNMLANLIMVTAMDKELPLSLGGKNTSVDTKLTKNMDMALTLFLMEQSMLVNIEITKNMDQVLKLLPMERY